MTRLGGFLDKVMKKVNPSAQRNREPILAVLRQTVQTETPLRCLEIASGSGTHVGYFAQHLPNITWQPSDCDTENMESLRVYQSEHTNILEPIVLDISKTVSLERFQPDVILCINMIHISPWAATLGLFANAGNLLRAGGLLITYGPYRHNGVLSPDSNRSFDASLRGMNEEWGIREINDLELEAAREDLELDRILEMPANNKMLIFTKY